MDFDVIIKNQKELSLSDNGSESLEFNIPEVTRELEVKSGFSKHSENLSY